MFAQVPTQQQIQSAWALDQGWNISPEESQAMQLVPIQEDFYAYSSPQDYYAYSGFSQVKFDALNPITWSKEQTQNFIINYNKLIAILKPSIRSTKSVKGFGVYGDLLSTVADGISNISNIVKGGADSYNSVNSLLHPPNTSQSNMAINDIASNTDSSRAANINLQPITQSVISYLPWVVGFMILSGAAIIIFKPKKN